jgi:hypothetical protein
LRPEAEVPGETAPDAEPGEVTDGGTGRPKPVVDPRVEPWLTELPRTVVGALGRADGMVLGRTPGLEPRDGLGEADGREKLPPLEGRGELVEPREPWLEEGRE